MTESGMTSRPAPGSAQAVEAAQAALLTAIALYGEGSPRAREALRAWLSALVERNRLLRN